MAPRGDRPHTIHDVARLAGVSASSVSRTLNGHPNVSNRLRQRVEAAVQALEFHPNPAAQMVRGGRTGLIGFLIDNMTNGPIYASVDRELRSHGYSMLLINAENDPTLSSAYLQLMARRRVDGLLIDSGVANWERVADDLVRLQIPAVLFDRDLPADAPHLGVVQSDLAGGIRAAVAHLIEQGHQRIALINGPGYWWPAHERLHAFLEGLRVGGLPATPELIRSMAMNAPLASAEATELLNLPHPPTALIVGGNVLLLGVLRALQAHGCAVGRDLAVVGADDLDLTQLYSPPITVIRRELNVRGETAVQLLTDMIQHGRGRVITLPTELVIRKSSTLWRRVAARRA
ncbi:MAG: LacI family DNA-binding transcriptional regulator [Thermomicrobiales bacterium]